MGTADPGPLRAESGAQLRIRGAEYQVWRSFNLVAPPSADRDTVFRADGDVGFYVTGNGFSERECLLASMGYDHDRDLAD
jgi:hypothetical protein